MPELADIFRRHGPEYLSRFSDRMLPSHIVAMQDIMDCRTEAMGGHVYICDDCASLRFSYHSCKNRHCPKCGNDSTDMWLQKQLDLLLPQTYFLLTFTLPEELRSLASSNQKAVYDLLFTASSEAVKKLALDSRLLGGRLAMLGVLHTWGRDLCYHPHIHYIIAGGALSSDNRWRCSSEKFIVPVVALSPIFRAKFRDGLKKLGLHDSVGQRVWKKGWVVHSKPVGAGEAALRYLAPYVYRVALSNNRIEQVSEDKVTFSYKESATGTWRTMSLSPIEFIRRFLQHVLPDGFHKVRYYGLLSPRNRKIIKLLQNILTTHSALEAILKPNEQKESSKPGCSHRGVAPLLCTHCGGTLKPLKALSPTSRGPPW
jgi:hypothetical protein